MAVTLLIARRERLSLPVGPTRGKAQGLGLTTTAHVTDLVSGPSTGGYKSEGRKNGGSACFVKARHAATDAAGNLVRDRSGQLGEIFG